MKRPVWLDIKIKKEKNKKIRHKSVLPNTFLAQNKLDWLGLRPRPRLISAIFCFFGLDPTGR